jgi:hypothetical protein
MFPSLESLRKELCDLHTTSDRTAPATGVLPRCLGTHLAGVFARNGLVVICECPRGELVRRRSWTRHCGI